MAAGAGRPMMQAVMQPGSACAYTHLPVLVQVTLDTEIGSTCGGSAVQLCQQKTQAIKAALGHCGVYGANFAAFAAAAGNHTNSSSVFQPFCALAANASSGGHDPAA